MAYEDNSGLNVNNHYGPRGSGGTQGVERTAGVENEATINFDGEALNFYVEVPAGAVITDMITDFSTGAVATAVVGAVDISTVSPTSFISVPLGGSHGS